MGFTLTSIISLRQLDVGTLPAATQAGRLLTTKLRSSECSVYRRPTRTSLDVTLLSGCE